jgi:hypothetical protein
MNYWAIFSCPLRGLVQTLAIVRLKMSKLQSGTKVPAELGFASVCRHYLSVMATISYLIRGIFGTFLRAEEN